MLDVDLSRHIRPNQSSSVHQVVEAVGVGDRWDLDGGSEPSRHPPNQPGYLQDVVCEDVGEDVVVVAVGAGAGVVLWGLDFVVVGSSSSSPSLQPNHPGVLQDEVDVVFVFVVLVVVADSVVDSSRHPHQPGVLHVSVRVRVELD